MTAPPDLGWVKPPTGCLRTGIRDRFVCVERWPNDASRWCSGCAQAVRALAGEAV